MPVLSDRPISPRSFHAFILAATLGVFALGDAAVCGAQSVAPPQHPAAVTPSAAEEEGPSVPARDDASHQTIKVHGHWKIVVKNADGTIAQTRDFENSLAGTTGATFLADILGGQYTPGQFAIYLTTTGTSICATSTCVVVPNTTTGIGSNVCTDPNNTCTAGMTTAVSNGTKVIYAGQLTATRAGTISTVSTEASFCAPSISVNSCNVATAQVIPLAFTATTISPITVNSGQIVQVSVTISFS